MARYIDAEKFIDFLKKEKETAIAIGDGIRAYETQRRIDLVSSQPTADVVPKSEVEKWKEINEQLHKEMSERMIEERKIERKLVAREIFEEIERNTINSNFEFMFVSKKYFAELKKKYTEGISNDIQG